MKEKTLNNSATTKCKKKSNNNSKDTNITTKKPQYNNYKKFIGFFWIQVNGKEMEGIIRLLTFSSFLVGR